MNSRRRVWLAGAVGAAVALLHAPGVAHSAEEKLTITGGAIGDQAGTAVAIDGDTAVVGAPQAGNNGAAYVFERTAGTWSQAAKLTSSSTPSEDQFGASVAIDGDTIVVGAPLKDEPPATAAGAVYTFTRTGGDRTETAKLIRGEPSAFDRLGLSVAIDGDTIVAGASGVNQLEGAAYTFAATGDDRTEAGTLTASDGVGSAKVAGDEFGTSVAIDGDVIVVGSPLADTAATTDNKGAAYTFATIGDAERTETGKLTASDGAASDNLGSSVDVNGDTIVAGAPGAGGGAVYTFARTGTNPRSQTAKLTASNGTDGDDLGRSVAIDGDNIVAGAPDNLAGQDIAGAAYAFARTGPAARTETFELVPGDPGPGDNLFGASVGASGESLIVGAPFDSPGGVNQAGSASVFDADVPPIDTDPPGLELTAEKKQKIGKTIAVTADTDENCDLVLSGSVKPKNGSEKALKDVEASLVAGVPADLELKVSKGLQKDLKKAKRGKATLEGTCADAAGNEGEGSAKVSLKK
ncbi:MAG TPA: FG-GAP repeat protein [Solirubrobacterales bacterium]|nr:FG-GAP repeat protein [Solirubrobacterales bacterium]